ncbi:MAG: CAP domain-containing protein [Chloroflexi bacterium]|nr:CAP domain-containing protein [Chloroflexota bacterium]MCC6892811.1 hypothetical protein [Anaerolineae bacterium]
MMSNTYTRHLGHWIARITVILLILMGISNLPQNTAAQPAVANDTVKAAEILAQVNAWRVENGLWPLTVNPTLEALAMAQASYVLPFLPNIQNEEQYHLDAKLRNPRQRGEAAGWPSYGTNADRIEVGENAGVGTARFVMNFWRSSPIHAKAALNPTYREVGVAALPTKNGTFYMIDFGARPDVLPVVVSADGTKLWLTEEKSRYATVTGATRVRLLDATGKPLTEFAAWSSTLTIPADVPDSLQVVYMTGDKQVTTMVALRPSLTSAVATNTPAPAISASPTPASAVGAANPTTVPVTRAPDVTPTVPAVPTIDPAKADILLTYDATSLILRNNSASAEDVSNLSILGSGVTVGMPLWTKLSDFPSAAFPSSHCVAIQLSNTDLSIPANCKWTRSIVNLTPAKIFWTMDNFIVSVNGTTLATCKPGDGICAIDLP